MVSSINILLLISIIFAIQLCLGRSEIFAPKIEWKCSEDAIRIQVRTEQPFFGLIHPMGSRHSNCSVRGTGRHITSMQIPLSLKEGPEWQNCGLQLEEMDGTLWMQLEVHEHPLLILRHDRVLNISCAGWDRDEKNPYRIALRPANPSSAEQMSPTAQLTFGAAYDMLLFGPSDHSILIHSCNASSADRSIQIELIDTDGCSIDQNLMADFHPLTLPPPATSATFQLASSPGNSSTRGSHRVAMATARIPSMFRFNSASPNSELVRIECRVQPCGESGQRACKTQQDCDAKRELARQQFAETQQTAQGEIELVTQLLGSEEVPPEEATGIAIGQSDLLEANSSSSTTLAKEGTSTQAATNGTISNNTGITGTSPVKQNSANVANVGWHRVRIVARVLDGNGGIRGGWVNSGRTNATKKDTIVPTTTTAMMPTSSTSTPAQKASTAIIVSKTDPNNEGPTLKRLKVPAPFQFQRDFVGTSPSTAIPLTSHASPVNALSNSQCVSADQLLRLYQLSVGLCGLFLLGCFCNLLLCCWNRRPSGAKSHSPLRLKRGRRQQSVLVPSGPPSNSTLTSSLYGPGNVVVQNANGEAQKAQKGAKEESAPGFWINAEGRENEADQFGPMMVSSIYGALPTQQPAAAPSSSNRRSSVHSYASVKAPHSTKMGTHQQLLGSRNIINTNTNNNGQQQQCHELVQQSGISPAHSPSTTTSSSGGFQPVSGGQQPSLNCRTFHPQMQQHPVQKQNFPPSSSLASSSVRSSTLGTPSPSETEPTGTSTPRPSSDVIQEMESNNSTFGRPLAAQQQHFLTTNGHQPMQNESFSIL